MSDPQYPADRILWRRWSAETVKEIVERGRPVLLFVADPDGLIFPFLREIFHAAPTNERLRTLLHEDVIGLYMEIGEIPENEVGLWDAGKGYHLAILSPSGLTPIVTFAAQRGDPDQLVAEVVEVLDRMLETWV